jgi:hypothetical protein
MKRGSFFSNLAKGVQDFTTSTISEATKVQEKIFQGQTQAEQISFTCLWEIPEPVEYCRECKTRFQLIKHHCRSCAGVFCDDCCPSAIPNSYERTLIPSTLNIAKGEYVRLCLGCKRGECPGIPIKDKIRRQLDGDKVDLSSGKITKFQKKVGAKIEEAFTTLGDATDAESGRRKAYYYFYELKRGSYYGENNMMRKAGSKTPAVSGYFEIYNKSSEVIAVKLLKRLSNDINLVKFEIPRPSYLIIPPSDAVYCFFDPEDDDLELIILYQNPNPIPSDAAMVYDTKAHGANPNRLSLCARIDLFHRVQVYSIASTGKNALLKYKGLGIVHPREGNSAGRVGVFGYFSGKRYAEGKLDYQTNVLTVHPSYTLT